MAFVHSPKIVTDGLVLALDAGNVKSYPGSGTTWLDKSGRGNNGTLINGPTFNSGNGGSIVFDGVDDYVTVNTPISLNLIQPSSINTWFYFNNFDQVNSRIIECQDNNYSIQIIRDGASGLLSTKNSNFQTGISGTTWFTPDFGIWYNITAIWIPSTASTQLYLNGISQTGNFFNNIGIGNQPNKIVLGVRSDFFNTTWLNGRISLTQIYNRALSAAEVLQNYNATKGRFGL
jgi:hypothetical protein